MTQKLKLKKNKKLEKTIKWRISHLKKVYAIINKNNIREKDLADYFLFENLRRRHPGFCPLFKKGNEPCHEGIEKKYFCCLFCACPNYIAKEIKDKIGACLVKISLEYTDDNILDCTNCAFVHDIAWVRKNVNKLKKI